ncbi:tyrosyl-tRNA synthetase [Candidatus Nitrososphaera evergladensis SR1]|uniref:tyrosine--tRNA ligase n=1 Tax=Candidatus Nitrososphaera evergladensis SR1 TaxID=1459636 RepID=A0A075MPK8_9ARCH|nr:tyrosine--tRNA ligase [Candidatus Nitrososphaera evergladensis]AIF83148.1 tyrosyl-tRNA synthetase [Candidatus Nitrososphaera evergladensis SR1]
MDVQERIALVMREPTEEVITAGELKALFETKSKPRHYIGLEISGILHLGSLILTGFKINDFIKAGIDCTVFLADWHTYINDKLGGDWDRIRKVSEYYADAFRFFCPGVNIVTGSDLYAKTPDYWENFVRFSKHMTLARTMRSLTIMGRKETDNMDLGQLLYPPMQSVDIKALDLDIVHSGMDQRKIHMLVREIFPKMGWKPPVCVHHHLLPGLAEPVKLGLDENAAEDAKVSSKMSKSKPSSGILIHDDEKAIRDKMAKAFCPVGVAEGNPVLELVRYVVFHEFSEFTIERPAKYGGNTTYGSYKNVEDDFVAKKIHPMDLKNATATYVNRIIEPVYRHFKGREPALN